MRRRFHAGALAVAIVASSSLLAAQEWPRFRGNEAGVAADDPALPDTWSPTENVAWTRPIPGIGWSSPVVWGDHVFVTSVVNTAQQEPPKPGFYLGDWPASSCAASMDGLRHRLPDRRGAMGEGSQQCAAGQGQTSEEQLCLGDRGHRRRACLFLFRQCGPLRLRPLGQAGVVESDESAQDAEQLGHVRISGSPSGPHLHRQRQRRAVVRGGLRHEDGRRGLESRAEGRHELVVAVRLGERSAHGDRDDRVRSRAVIRSVGQAAVGILRHVHHQHPDAVLEVRPPLHQLGIHRGSQSTGVRDSAGRVRRHLAEAR